MTTPASRDARIAAIAHRQHGLITTAQLRACGLGDSSIRKRVDTGRLHRLHRGVHAVGHGSVSRDGTWMAAVLAAGGDAALSHVAAAAHWRIWRRGGAVETTLVASRRVRGLVGVRVIVTRTLHRRDVRVRFDIRVTSVERTILDLGSMLSPWQLANVLHEAEYRNRLSLRELDRVLARNRGSRAVTTVRRALEIRATGSWGTLSDLEDAFLAMAHDRGLDPLVNCAVDVLEGTVRPDFCWPEAMIAIEVDGSPHGRVRTKREDRGKAAQLREAGYVVLRCGADDMDACLDDVVRRMSEAGVLV
jgi:very-short-patch-repair endonuclease